MIVSYFSVMNEQGHLAIIDGASITSGELAGQDVLPVFTTRARATAYARSFPDLIGGFVGPCNLAEAIWNYNRTRGARLHVAVDPEPRAAEAHAAETVPALAIPAPAARRLAGVACGAA